VMERKPGILAFALAPYQRQTEIKLFPHAGVYS